jgi:hypothetical protein
MIGQMQPFSVAWDTIRSNEARSYPNLRDSGTSGYERITASDFPNLMHRPKFQLKQTDRFFTIGSCFARNVERQLIARGMDVLNTTCRIDGSLYSNGGSAARNSALNAYTPHSMRDLVRFAARDDWQSVGTLQVDEQGNSWCDMLLAGLRYLSPEELLGVREQLRNTYLSLAQADVCILTLGYTESWYDEEHRMFTNRSPAGARQTSRYGDRFSFFNADASAVQTALEDIIEAIGMQTQNRAKIILTVSPVPMSGTYTPMDVICANTYSKSTLLTSARQVANKFDHVDYFPSYEYVTLSKAKDIWKDDGTHVNDAIVSKIITKFVELYFPGAEEEVPSVTA